PRPPGTSPGLDTRWLGCSGSEPHPGGSHPRPSHGSRARACTAPPPRCTCVAPHERDPGCGGSRPRPGGLHPGPFLGSPMRVRRAPPPPRSFLASHSRMTDCLGSCPHMTYGLIVESLAPVRVACTQRFFPNLQRAFVESLRLSVLALVCIGES